MDVLIIGAGPAGLAVAIECEKNGLSYLVIEKGAVANSILRYPTQMTFFSTPQLLEIGQVPFTTPNNHPTRIEGLVYYREVADHFGVRLKLGEAVESVVRQEPEFIVKTSKSQYSATTVVVATGYFDNPMMLGIPGEDLPHVSHYYSEAFPFYQKHVVIIGSQNSAAEAALDLHQHKARVTMIVRGPKIGESVKYWIKPNLENRIKSGAIKVYFNTEVKRIEQDVIEIASNLSPAPSKEGSTSKLPCDQLFALTGYKPNVPLLERFGIEVDPVTLIPKYNPDTFETNIPGLFIAGSVACGCETGTIFIENGRLHASSIIGIVKRRMADAKKTRIIE